jgi:Mg2+ and Co2+ transporter CorA
MEIARLTGIIEVGRQRLTVLTTENDHLRQSLDEANSIISSHGYKRLYRAQTKTDWSPDVLEGLQTDLKAAMEKMQKEEMMKKFQKQDELYWTAQSELDSDAEVFGTGYQPDEIERGTSAISALSGDSGDAPAYMLGVSMPDPDGGDTHLFRPMTKTDWDQAQLDMLKLELQSEIQQLHKASMAEVFEKQDQLRMGDIDGSAGHVPASSLTQATVPSADTDSETGPFGFGIEASAEDMAAASGDPISSLKADLKAQVMQMRDESAKALSTREDELSAMPDDELEKRREEMRAQIERMNKEDLDRLFEKQMDLRREVLDPTKPIIIDPEALAAMSAEERRRNLVRMQSTDGWTDDQLERIRQDMESVLKEQRQSTKKADLMKMFDKRDGMYDAPVVESTLPKVGTSSEEYIDLKKKFDRAESELSRAADDQAILQKQVNTLTSELREMESMMLDMQDSKLSLIESAAKEMDRLRGLLGRYSSAKAVSTTSAEDS